MTLRVNDRAPAFSLPDQHGKIHALSDYHGQWVLLYFYPKDDTPGCTTEACRFRDHLPAFTKQNVVIIGVSVDGAKSHEKFAQKYQLPFTLLADEDKKIVNAYGVWQQKKFMGRQYTGIARTSFLINPQGMITKIYEKVKPPIHALEVLADLKLFSPPA